jgi:hypothetical protein
MAEDCVCCEAIDISKSDAIHLTANKFLISRALVDNQNEIYSSLVKTLIPYTNQVRAPPIV